MTYSTIPRGPAPAAHRPPGVEPLLELVADDVLALIRKHRKQQYVSHSNIDDIPTGNRYQTVALGESEEPGFRSHRNDLFSRIVFQDATVLDIGCNTGELSRLARQHGATLVDGFDFDPFWIALAQLANVHNSVARVSFYAADATDPQAYQGQYDIVLAFSVFPYISKALPALVEATRKVLILETHVLSRPTAEKQYFDALGPYFPSHRELDSTDWGREREGRRKVIAFARTDEMLDVTLRPPAAREAHGEPSGVLDVERSELGYLKKFEETFRDQRGRNFDALLEAVSACDPGAFDDAAQVASGVGYWVAFLRGYDSFCKMGDVNESNYFVHFLRDLFHQRPFDLGLLSTINDTSRLVERVRSRYLTLDRMRSDPGSRVEPVVLFNTSRGRESFRIYDRESDRWLSCEAFDGYHRLFSARVTGRSELPFVLRDTPTER